MEHPEEHGDRVAHRHSDAVRALCVVGDRAGVGGAEDTAVGPVVTVGAAGYLVLQLET